MPTRPSPAWWIYFGLLVVFALGGLLGFATQLGTGAVPRSYLVVSAVGTLLNLLGITGLLLFILGRPLVGRGFWQGVFGLTVLQFLFSATQFARVLGMPGGGRESVVARMGLVGLLLGVPLLFVLWRYAFRSPALWSRRGPKPA